MNRRISKRLININNIHGRCPSPPRAGFLLGVAVRGVATRRGCRVLPRRRAVLHDGQRAPVIIGDPANPHSVRPQDGDVPLPPASFSTREVRLLPPDRWREVRPPLSRGATSIRPPPIGNGGREGAATATTSLSRIRKREAAPGGPPPTRWIGGGGIGPPWPPIPSNLAKGMAYATRQERSERGERKREKDKAYARSAWRLCSV